MKDLLVTTWSTLRDLPAFFGKVCEEGWRKRYHYFSVIALVSSIISAIAGALGVDGASPLTTSTTAQRHFYRWWQDVLSPKVGIVSPPLPCWRYCWRCTSC